MVHQVWDILKSLKVIYWDGVQKLLIRQIVLYSEYKTTNSKYFSAEHIIQKPKSNNKERGSALHFFSLLRLLLLLLFLFFYFGIIDLIVCKIPKFFGFFAFFSYTMLMTITEIPINDKTAFAI